MECHDMLLTIKEITEKTKLSESTIRRLIRADRFPSPILFGRKRVWPEAAIREWIYNKISSQE